MSGLWSKLRGLVSQQTHFPAPSLRDDAQAKTVRDALAAFFASDRDGFRKLFLAGEVFGPKDDQLAWTAAFADAGLARTGVAGTVRANVRVFPLDDMFIATDLLARRSEDQVFSLMFEQAFLTHVMEISPGDRVLELCLGSGVNLLAAARRGAGRIAGVDVNERAISFAAFNARLNGALLDGTTPALETFLGDLYAPLAKDDRFDLILVNPPFELVPPGSSYFLHSHGGADGLDLIRRMLPQTPERLRPGGRFEMYTWSPGSERDVAVVGLVAQTFPEHRIEVRLPGWAPLDDRISTFKDAPGYATWRESLLAAGHTRVWDVHVRAAPIGAGGIVQVETRAAREKIRPTVELWTG